MRISTRWMGWGNEIACWLCAALFFYCFFSSVHSSQRKRNSRKIDVPERVSRYIELSMSPNCRDYCVHMYETEVEHKRCQHVLLPLKISISTIPVIIAVAVAVAVDVQFVSISVNVISFLHIFDLMAIRPFRFENICWYKHMLKLTRTRFNTDYLCTNEFNVVSFLLRCLFILSFLFDWFVKHLSAHELLYT